MPPPIPVVLAPPSPEWAETTAREAARLKGALGDTLVAVHHIGSTAIPGIVAKPVVDLIPEVTSLAALDAAKDRVTTLGYAWWGEYGIPDRRFCTLRDPADGRRLVHLHCFASGSPHIARHLAFRDGRREAVHEERIDRHGAFTCSPAHHDFRSRRQCAGCPVTRRVVVTKAANDCGHLPDDGVGHHA